MVDRDPFDTRAELKTASETVGFYRLDRLDGPGRNIARLPGSIKVLLEAALRQVDDVSIPPEAVRAIAGFGPETAGRVEVPFRPARVILQDFTGVPSLVDLAALRWAAHRLGGDPRDIQPRVPVDLVIDHSLQVDRFGCADAAGYNAQLELVRNRERYAFLRWGQAAFDRFRVVPPATGIVHQVNLEYLARVVVRAESDAGVLAFPDSLVGTDSHTTMINGLGVLGWGVGGIEAEAVMLGQPIYLVLPEVVGFELKGELLPGVTATDLVLRVAQMLRQFGVVGRLVEFCGDGLRGLSLEARATVANMAPEYGATAGYFPVDDECLRYLRLTGRTPEQVDLVERYCKEQGLFGVRQATEMDFSHRLELDLSSVVPSLAGPKRPHDRVPLNEIAGAFGHWLAAPVGPRGFGLPSSRLAAPSLRDDGQGPDRLEHGSVVIAAITSCTNTSNPSLMIAAGLLARKAVERGLRAKPWVKTSLAPGSKVVHRYLQKSGLMRYLEELRFHLVGFGCTTCIGNSGPLPDEISRAVTGGDLVVAAVLSGNRNFEGRIHPLTRANFLASPPLVVAYALTGDMKVDLTRDPIGVDPDGTPVFLKDVWPDPDEIAAVIDAHLSPEDFTAAYADVFTGNVDFNALPAAGGDLFPWDPESTYIREPPFFRDLNLDPPAWAPIQEARALAVFGDSVTTDHISPAGSIAHDSPAANYLREQGVAEADFNSYGSRRGNHEVMMRGTFANIRINNALVPGVEGAWTIHVPTGERMSIWDAAERYRAAGTPLVILAGQEYGSGSSRDWAAKGPWLQGVRVVIARSFERIHRSNLVGMGILPLQFQQDQSVQSLGLNGRERYWIETPPGGFEPGIQVQVRAMNDDGQQRRFLTDCRIDTPVEATYYRNGGILQTVLRKRLHASAS